MLPIHTGIRTTVKINIPVELAYNGMYGYVLKINMRRLTDLYDVKIPSPGRLTTRKQSRLQCKLKRPSKAEQKKIFTRYLQNGKAQNQSELARRFNVSRAWISKVMNS